MASLSVRATGLAAGFTGDFWVMRDLVGKTSTSSLKAELRQILSEEDVGNLWDQIVSWVEDVADTAVEALSDPIGPIFQTVVVSNVAMSAPISIPNIWEVALSDYADAEPGDGIFLQFALALNPDFHRGGWIMDLQPEAAAMTLDEDVFIPAGKKLSLSTYIHEMVHVFQYNAIGTTPFLTSYFGLSAITIAYRFIRQEDLEVMESSPHEEQAYNVESRFEDWYRSHHGGLKASDIQI